MDIRRREEVEADDVIRLELSQAQREVWLAQRLAPHQPFNVVTYAEVNGPVDQGILELAVALVVRETDALRTRFRWENGEIYRYIGAYQDTALRVIDLGASGDPAASALEWIGGDLVATRAPESGDLAAFTLLRLGERRFIWYQRYHHIVIDGRSAGMLAKRVATIYSLLAGGQRVEPRVLAEAPFLLRTDLTYRSSGRYSEDRKFWQQNFHGDPISAWFSRAAASRRGGRYSYVEVADSQVEPGNLSAVAKGFGVPPMHLWASAVAIHFHLLTRRAQLQFSLGVAGVTTAEADVPGMSANVIPFRVRVEPTAQLKDVCRQITREMFRVLGHQRYRGEDIRRDQDIAGHEWFGPVINLMTFDGGPPFAGCEARWHVPVMNGGEDFAVWILDTCDGFGGQLFLRDIDSGSSMAELEEHKARIVAILTELCGNPGQSVLSLARRLAERSYPLLARSIYGRRGYLEAAGCLRWKDADGVIAQVRSLAFGEGYDNPVARPAIVLGAALVYVTECVKGVGKSGFEPGTLVEISHDSWTIATQSEDVRVSGFVGEDGVAAQARLLAERSGITVGDRLCVISDEESEILTHEHRAAALSEDFWWSPFATRGRFASRTKSRLRAHRGGVSVTGRRRSFRALSTALSGSRFSWRLGSCISPG